MTPCASVGLEPSWMCNELCAMCYYRRDARLGTHIHRPLDEMKKEVDAAKRRGCTNAYLVGFGEPMLYRQVIELIQYATDSRMGSSVITNGAIPIKRYEQAYAAGLDHPHISMHGLGDQLSQITENKNAGAMQAKVLAWLRDSKLPFRTNTTVQRLNYTSLPAIAQAAIDYGVVHFVLINFLPHYEWKEHFNEVGVPTVESRPYIEAAADLVLKAGRLLTIRYFPHCMLAPRFWPHVTNACYVPFDPFEWENAHHDTDVEKVWKFAMDLGNQVAVQGKPCDDCRLKLHCGGWNKTSVQYDGGHIHALSDADVPEQYRGVIGVRGGLHDLNPANAHCGFLRQATIDNVVKLKLDPEFGSALAGGPAARRKALAVLA